LPCGKQTLLVHSLYGQHSNDLAHRVATEILLKLLADYDNLS
jgi:hypothetical protein